MTGDEAYLALSEFEMFAERQIRKLETSQAKLSKSLETSKQLRGMMNAVGAEELPSEVNIVIEMLTALREAVVGMEEHL